MFNWFESSRSKASPATLYHFRVGPNVLDFLAFTDAEHPILIGNVNYTPAPMIREKIVANGSLDRNQLVVRTARTNPVAELFKPYPPSYTVSLIVYVLDLNDPAKETIAIWNGRVLGVTLEGDEAVLAGEPISSQRHRPGLRRCYQYGCPHVLYSQGPGQCNANKERATVANVSVASVDGFKVYLPEGWPAQARADRFNGGLLEWTRDNGRREFRTILSVENGRVLTLGGPPSGLRAGMKVDVVYGCGHNMESCRDVHKNLVNYGGHPFIPTVNPIGLNNQFY